MLMDRLTRRPLWTRPQARGAGARGPCGVVAAEPRDPPPPPPPPRGCRTLGGGVGSGAGSGDDAHESLDVEVPEPENGGIVDRYGSRVRAVDDVRSGAAGEESGDEAEEDETPAPPSKELILDEEYLKSLSFMAPVPLLQDPQQLASNSWMSLDSSAVRAFGDDNFRVPSPAHKHTRECAARAAAACCGGAPHARTHGGCAQRSPRRVGACRSAGTRCCPRPRSSRPAPRLACPRS